MQDTPNPRNILLTGASGGLGSALARHYARPGTHFVLWGRDAPRLAETAEACTAAGATADILSHDLTDVEGAIAALIEADEKTPFDIAIFTSGLGDIRAPGALVEDAALVTRLGTVNFVAPAAMAAALADRMAARHGGKIVLIGSAASFHALPFAAAYSGSKAGLAQFAKALGTCMRPHGVDVTLVSPGFIDTEAARRIEGPKPFALRPADAAARIAKAAAKGKAHVVMPWPFALLRIFDRVLPRPLRERLLRSLAPPTR